MPGTGELDQRATAAELTPGRVAEIDVGPLSRGDGEARAALLRQIRDACLGTGFFHVRNTGIGDDLLARVLAHMRRFFELPDAHAIKRAVHHGGNPGGHGWTPLFEEPAYQPNTRAHLQSFDCGPPRSAFASPEEAARLGIGPNVWPDLPGFRAVVREYYAACSRLGHGLFEAFAEMLELEPGFFTARSSESAPKTLRLLQYPPAVAAGDARDVGIAAHTDFECFTVMYETAPGLELTDVEGRWYRIPHGGCDAAGGPATANRAPGARFTIILGDMLERWTNGLLKATGHRVARTPWERYAIVMFFAADADCVVAPLPQFVSRSNPARFAPITQGAHIRAELERADAHREQMAPAPS